MKALALLISVGLAGCGQSLCEKRSDATKSLQEKASPCPSVSSLMAGQPSAQKDLANCERQIKECNPDEQKRLADSFDCTQQLPACAAGKESDWISKTMVCGNGLSGLSQVCKDAVF